MTPTWVILAVPCAAVAGYVIVRRIRVRRRTGREWAAHAARRVRERNAETELLEHLYAMESAGEQ